METKQSVKNAAVINLFEGAYLQGQEVFVKVNAPDVETFHSQVSELSDIRRTRRFNSAKTAERETFKFVRQSLALKGKHVHIHVITETPEQGVFKSESGATVQINDSFSYLTARKVANEAAVMSHISNDMADEGANDTNEMERQQHAG